MTTIKHYQNIIKQILLQDLEQIGPTLVHDIDKIKYALNSGKRFRSALLLSIINDDKLALAVEYYHTSRILFDDMVYQNTQRRGNQAFWYKFGTACTVLTANYFRDRALSLLTESDLLQQALLILNRQTAHTYYQQQEIENYSQRKQQEILINLAKERDLFSLAILLSGNTDNLLGYHLSLCNTIIQELRFSSKVCSYYTHNQLLSLFNKSYNYIKHVAESGENKFLAELRYYLLKSYKNYCQ